MGRSLGTRGRAERLTCGASYTEVLVAVAVLAIALVPAVEALRTGLSAGQIHADSVAHHYLVVGKVEEVLAEDFGDLDAEALAAGSPTVATAYSDGAGSDPQRLVYLARYDGDDADADGDPFTGGDEGLLWLRVEIAGGPHAIETLTTP